MISHRWRVVNKIFKRVLLHDMRDTNTAVKGHEQEQEVKAQIIADKMLECEEVEIDSDAIIQVAKEELVNVQRLNSLLRSRWETMHLKSAQTSQAAASKIRVLAHGGREWRVSTLCMAAPTRKKHSDIFHHNAMNI